MWFCNIIYYYFYRFEIKTQAIISFPIEMILRTKKVREAYQKKNISDPVEIVRSVVNNPKTGITSIISGGMLYATIFILIFGLFNLTCVLLDIKIDMNKWYFIIMCIIASTIGYWLTDYKGRYLIYFRMFDKMHKKSKIKWALIRFFTIISIWSFSIGAFILRFC